MAKINDGVGSGGTNPSSNEFTLDTDLFKDEIDKMRGQTIGIEVVRAIKPRFNVDEKDSFETDQKVDIGADTPRDIAPGIDISKKRRESDTGLTFQMKRQLRQNIKG